MTTSIVKIERTSGSIGRPSVAPGPSGGTYFAEGSNSTGIAHVARLDSAGALVWTKEITISGSTTANGVTPNIYSSTDHVVVVLRYFETAGSVYKTSVVLYQSDGTLVWEKTVPISISRAVALAESFTGGGIGGIALAEDESVYLTGTLSTNTQLALVKLNGSDGTLAWVVDLYPSVGALTGDWPAEIELLSGGDPVVTFFGYDIGSLGEEYTHVQRITASTGAAAWTRSVFWGYGSATGAAIGVDPSDNIYLSWPINSGNDIGVVKLDASGGTLWNRAIDTNSTVVRGALKLAATATGVFVSHRLSSTGAHGHYFVASAGTTGAGVVTLTRYTIPGSVAYEARSSRAAGSQVPMVLSDVWSSVYRAGLVLSDTTSGDDGSYGGIYVRATSTITLNTGSATIATPTYTRASTPSLTVAASSITETSGGLTATPLAVTAICTATGVASALAFGLPIMIGVQLPYTVSTSFGTADARNRHLYATGKASELVFGTALGKTTYPAIGLAPTVTFGTAVYTANASKTATGLAPTIQFGVPLSIRGVAPAPIGLASSLDPATTFGTATATSVLYGTATGVSTTAFGTTTHAQGLPATALAPATTFGTPNGPVLAHAQGFSTTAFGAATASCLGYPTSLPSTTVFGAPALRNVYLCAATGWSSTVLGTPLTRWPTRTRSAVFRTQFGRAQAERTLP